MKCPMTMNGSYGYQCEKDNCAWWCAWSNSCAITVLASEMAKSYHLNVDKEFDRRFGKRVD